MFLVDVVVAVAPPEWWQVALPYAAALVSGAVGGGVVSLIGAKLQFNRDHARWLKEERLENYAEIVRIIGELERLTIRMRALDVQLSEVVPDQSDAKALEKLKVEAANQHDRMPVLLEEVSRATSRGYLITGSGTDAAIANHADLLGNWDKTPTSKEVAFSRRKMIDAMRKDLNVS